MSTSKESSHGLHGYEFSLIDLIKILVKRWKIMGVIFSLIIATALAYSVLVPRNHQYTSVYRVAEESQGSALQSPQELVARAQNLLLEREVRALLSSTGKESLPFKVWVANPSDTLFLTLTSEAAESTESLVEQLHASVLEALQDEQHRAVEQRKKALQSQLENQQQVLDAVRDSASESAAEVVASTMNRISGIQSKLEELNDGEAFQIAVKSLEPTGTSRGLFMVLAVVMGGVLAIIGAFIAHFSSLVIASLKKEE